MAEPKHKVREVKKKTIIDKMLGSAIFILLVIIVVGVDLTAFIIWLSGLLSSDLEGKEIWTATPFYLFVGITAGLALFILVAWLVQRASKRRPASP